MDLKTKGRLIEKFVECSNNLALAKEQINKLDAKKEKLAALISQDNELGQLIVNGGISTLDGSLVALSFGTGSLTIKKVESSYGIKSELTADQLKAIKEIENAK